MAGIGAQDVGFLWIVSGSPMRAEPGSTRTLLEVTT